MPTISMTLPANSSVPFQSPILADALVLLQCSSAFNLSISDAPTQFTIPASVYVEIALAGGSTINLFNAKSSAITISLAWSYVDISSKPLIHLVEAGTINVLSSGTVDATVTNASLPVSGSVNATIQNATIDTTATIQVDNVGLSKAAQLPSGLSTAGNLKSVSGNQSSASITVNESVAAGGNFILANYTSVSGVLSRFLLASTSQLAGFQIYVDGTYYVNSAFSIYSGSGGYQTIQAVFESLQTASSTGVISTPDLWVSVDSLSDGFLVITTKIYFKSSLLIKISNQSTASQNVGASAIIEFT